MRRVLVILTVTGVALLGWQLLSRTSPTSPTRPTGPPADPPTATQTDPAEVFQRAFWRRPSAADRILHAERREWSDEEGVTKWQWFLVVEPSPELVNYLRKENAFSLVSASTPMRVRCAPEWFSFSPGAVEALQSPQGNMKLFFGKTDRLLYATDAGGGFTRGVEMPAPVQVVQAANPGRLPTTPPPDPRIHE